MVGGFIIFSLIFLIETINILQRPDGTNEANCPTLIIYMVVCKAATIT
jgi:hypothetical protein